MPESGRGLAAQVADKLGYAIASGEHGPGTVLRTEDLETRFSVSRTVVREAMQMLQAKRMLRSSPRVGLKVRDVDEWHLYDPDVIRWRLAGPARAALLDDLTELRGAVEPTAAGAAAQRGGKEERARLLECSARMRAAAFRRNREEFLQADIDFHCLVLGMCGNPLFAQLAPVTEQLLRSRSTLHLLPCAPDPADAGRHDAAAIAIAAGDAGGAEAAMRAVVAESLADIRMRLRAGDGAAGRRTS